MLIAGDISKAEAAAEDFGSTFELSTIARGLGTLQLFRLNVVQCEDRSVLIDEDDKLEAVHAYLLSLLRQRQVLEPLNAVKMRANVSSKRSLGLLGVHALLFFALANSLPQQLTPRVCVKELAKQVAILRRLKQVGPETHYPRPPNGEHHVSVLSFSDAGRSCETA